MVISAKVEKMVKEVVDRVLEVAGERGKEGLVEAGYSLLTLIGLEAGKRLSEIRKEG